MQRRYTGLNRRPELQDDLKATSEGHWTDLILLVSSARRPFLPNFDCTQTAAAWLDEMGLEAGLDPLKFSKRKIIQAMFLLASCYY